MILRRILTTLLLFSACALAQVNGKFNDVSACSIEGSYIVGSSCYPTIQSAITAAGTSFSVFIPATYTGTDIYTNPNGILIIDERGGSLQSSTIKASTLLASKGPVIDVQAYGAKCDGVLTSTGPDSGLGMIWQATGTDDSTAIAYALSAAGTNWPSYGPSVQGQIANGMQGVVRFPSNKVCISSTPIYVRPGVSVDLNNSTVAFTGTGNGFMVQWVAADKGYGAFRTFIKDGVILHADGTHPGYTTSTGSGLYLSMVNDGHFENLLIDGFKYGWTGAQMQYSTFVNVASVHNRVGCYLTSLIDPGNSATVNWPSIDNTFVGGSCSRNANYGIWEQNSGADTWVKPDLNWNGAADVVMGGQLPAFVASYTVTSGGSGYSTSANTPMNVIDDYANGLARVYTVFPGINLTPGTYQVTGTGGTWQTEPVITVTVAHNRYVSSVVVTTPGVCSGACNGAPSFSLTAAGGTAPIFKAGLCTTVEAFGVANSSGVLTNVYGIDGGEYCNNPHVIVGGPGTGATVTANVQDDSGLGLFDGTNTNVKSGIDIQNAKMEGEGDGTNAGDAAMRPSSGFAIVIDSNTIRNARFENIKALIGTSNAGYFRLMKNEGIYQSVVNPVPSNQGAPADPILGSYYTILNSQYPGVKVDWGNGWSTSAVPNGALIGTLTHNSDFYAGSTFTAAFSPTEGGMLMQSPTLMVGMTSSGSTKAALALERYSDSYHRFDVNHDGTMQWGLGSSAADVSLQHSGIQTMSASGYWNFNRINNISLTPPDNGATLTLADNSVLATSGANSATLTTTGPTNVTLPLSGTLATTSQLLAIGKVSFTGCAAPSGAYNWNNCTATVNWPTTLSTSNYSVFCSEQSSDNYPDFVKAVAVSTTSFTYYRFQGPNNSSYRPTISCIAVEN